MRFLEVIRGWLNRYFGHEEAIYLVALVAFVLFVVLTLGDVLMPVFIGLVLAFLLQGIITRLVAWRIPDTVAVWITFLMFVGGLAAVVLLLFPLIWRQTTNFANGLPDIVSRLQESLLELREDYPMISEVQVNTWIEYAQTRLGELGQALIASSISQLPSAVGLVVYVIMVPILVFFFLKDRALMAGWVLDRLPARRPLLDRVGREMNVQIANYVRGKFIEILIVGGVSWALFAIVGLAYPVLLGVLVGLSVIIPYVGAAVVTIPVVLVAYFQWGTSTDFMVLVGGYFVIQALDGNVLVPLLFSEANDLHPVAIIVAVLVFGGIWGVWGVFFAIPLATLVKAVWDAWPRHEDEEVAADPGSGARVDAAGDDADRAVPVP